MKADLLPTWRDGDLRLTDCTDAMRQRFAAIGLRLRCREYGLSERRLEFMRWQVLAGKVNDGDDRHQWEVNDAAS